MSAFVVKDTAINQVVTWLHQQRSDSLYHHKIREAFGLHLLDPADCERLAQDMFNLNCRAVRERYDEAYKTGMIPAKFTPKHESATAIQTYKSLQCWRYQCAEGDICETSILYAVMGEVLNSMARDIICALPEYKEAAWDWRSNGKTIH